MPSDYIIMAGMIACTGIGMAYIALRLVGLL